MTGNWQLTTGNCRSGFTLVEIMVAIAVATVLFGICTAIFVRTSQYKSRSEKLLFMAEEANGALGRIARDLAGLCTGGETLDKYWVPADPDGAVYRRLTFLSATENSGRADYCTVSYSVDNQGDLWREVSKTLGGVEPNPPATWPDRTLLARKVERLTFAFPAVAGKVPTQVEVTLQMADPEGRPATVTGYRRFAITVRPGSEENR